MNKSFLSHLTDKFNNSVKLNDFYSVCPLFSHFYNILTSVIKGIVNLPGNCFHISPAGIYSNWITIQGNLFARVETHRHTCRKIYMHV